MNHKISVRVPSSGCVRDRAGSLSCAIALGWVLTATPIDRSCYDNQPLDEDSVVPPRAQTPAG